MNNVKHQMLSLNTVAPFHMVRCATVKDGHLVDTFLCGNEDKNSERKTTEWRRLRQQSNCARVIQPAEFLSGLFPWFHIGPSSC